MSQYLVIFCCECIFHQRTVMLRVDVFFVLQDKASALELRVLYQTQKVHSDGQQLSCTYLERRSIPAPATQMFPTNMYHPAL